MSDTKINVQYSCPILGLTGLLFVALKLTHQIDWSWWWVTLPFWGLPVALAIAAGCLLFWCVLKLVSVYVDWEGNRRRRVGGK